MATEEINARRERRRATRKEQPSVGKDLDAAADRFLKRHATVDPEGVVELSGEDVLDHGVAELAGDTIGLDPDTAADRAELLRSEGSSSALGGVAVDGSTDADNQ